ncbi:MAG TPA: type 1 glutamine amidotransferase [Candidatus Saccharimonadales bacterium]
MKKLLIVKNITREGPGLLANVLEAEHISYDVVDLGASAAFPSTADYDAVVVLGGPDSANDQTKKMVKELAEVRHVLDEGKPYLGICLGLQVAVKAGGGKVVPGIVKEIGFHDQNGKQNVVTVTADGVNDPLFRGFEDELCVFQLHGETVELADGMQLLATGEHCRNQIVKLSDKAYGIQSHFELTPEMLSVWAAEDPGLIPLGKAKLLADFDAIKAEYTMVGETLLRNFLRIAGLLS